MRTPPTIGDKMRHWQAHMERWQKSGLSQQVYCRKHGLAMSTFQLWRKRLRTATESTALEIVPVPVPGVQASRVRPVDESPIGVVIGGGRYGIELREGFSVTALQQILNVLEVR